MGCKNIIKLRDYLKVIQPTILTIAGSDPSGGAGIQADLKTMTSIGVYGAAAITCLTVQNSLGVQEIHPVSADLVQAQVKAVLDDHNVSYIKIGMTGTVEIVECLGRILHTFSGSVVYDPVLAATSGASLLTKAGISALNSSLLPGVTYLTPNGSELELLSNKRIQSNEDAINSAHSLLDMYSTMKAVIVKGGHVNETAKNISDFLVQQDGNVYESKRERIHNNNNLHGTGCTYASALASYLCLGDDSISAFQQAGQYMDKIIRFGVDKRIVKSGSNGPLLHALK